MVLRKVLKMKIRMIGISLVVAMATAMFVSGLYTASVFGHSMTEFVEESKMPDIFMEFSEPINASEIDTIMADNGVSTYDMRLKTQGAYFYQGEVYPAFIIGIQDPERQDINKVIVEDGKVFSSSSEGMVITGMEEIGADTGEEASFFVGGQNLTFTISGKVRTAEYAMAGYMGETSVPVPGNVVVIFVSLQELQGILNITGVNDVVCLLDNDGQGEQLVEDMGHLPLTKVTLQKDHLTIVFMQLAVDKMNYMFPMFSVVFMIIGFIAIMMTAYRLVMNDSRYIGVLMSLGYTRAQIVRAYLVLGVALSLVGVVIGSILGFLFAAGLSSYSMALIGSFEVYYPLDPVPFIAGFFFTVGAVMFSVAIPVTIITRTSVREALDYKPRSKVATLRFSLPLPKSDMMGLRNATRNPARTIITVLVVGMTIAMAGSWLVFADSAWGYISESIERETWDMRADFMVPVPINYTEEVETYFGGETVYVHPYSSLVGQASFGGEETGIAVLGCDEIKEIKDFEAMEGKIDLDRAVITNQLADELGLSPGDTFTITVGAQSQEMEVSGIAYDVIQMVVYTTRANIADFTPEGNCTGVYIKLANPDMAESYAEQLRELPIIQKVALKEDILDTFSSLLDQAAGMLYFFFFISLMITIVVSASVVLLSTMERDVEFATMDTLGVSKFKIAKSILVEMLVLGILSALASIPLVYLFAFLFSKVMAEVLFYFPVSFALGATIITFFAGLAFVLLSSAFPIRYARKIDTEKTIRERITG
jgi:ABC-type lipoprotein release transport system permease subunit